MGKYRKLPKVIEASQWLPIVENGEHPKVTRIGASWGLKFPAKKQLGTPGCHHCGCHMADHGWIETLEGGHIVCHGDWIVKGVAGEFYPVKPAIFDATYERVDSSEAYRDAAQPVKVKHG